MSKPSEDAAVVAVIDPDANAVGAIVSAYVNMENFHSVMAVVMAGTLGASATLDFKLVQATDALGTGKKDITGKAITQLVQATNDDDQAVINLLAEELDVANGFSFVAMEMTVGVAASNSGAVMIGMDARYLPASDNDAATVQEIV